MDKDSYVKGCDIKTCITGIKDTWFAAVFRNFGSIFFRKTFRNNRRIFFVFLKLEKTFKLAIGLSICGVSAHSVQKQKVISFAKARPISGWVVPGRARVATLIECRVYSNKTPSLRSVVIAMEIIVPLKQSTYWFFQINWRLITILFFSNWCGGGEICDYLNIWHI